MPRDNSVFIISLGCAKNLVDSEHMLGLLSAKGFEPAPSLEEAGAVVVNTCGFIRDAVEESIGTILEVSRLKSEGRLKRLIVAGCFVQRYGYKLKRELPEVDAWLGTGEIYRIAEIMESRAGTQTFHIGRPTYLADHLVPRVLTTPFYSAYLRVAEGCSHGCTYCLIPSLRGPFRSRSMDSLLTEAKTLAGKGVKELNLIAQDTTMYGRDMGENACLESLLEGLLEIEDLRWIRLLYCYPDMVSDRLLKLMEREEKICPYLDIPLQHVNREILDGMGRDSGGESPGELMDRIRSVKRRISVRTTFMVGFPGETEVMFEELCDFVRSARFDNLGAFAYSPEEGTRAARLARRVEGAEAHRRLEALMKLQGDIAFRNNQRLVGRTLGGSRLSGWAD